MLRIHHLNCISTCPLGGKLMDGHTDSLVKRGHLTCHCQLIETDSELILVDTGFGLQDVRDPKSRLSRFFLGMVDPDFREEMIAIRQIERLGFDPRDVRHVLLTHLDFDHAGGLDDFPHAKVHLLREERDYAQSQKTWLDRQRFRPQQWNTQHNWEVYDPGEGEAWFGFQGVRQLTGLPPEILSVPLIGHTHGHVGYAVKLRNQWLLNAGDAYFYHAEMDVNRPHCTPGLAFYQTLMEKDRKARLENQKRLLEMKRAHGTEVNLFCSHDVVEFERLAGRSAEIPAEYLAQPPPRRNQEMPEPKKRSIYVVSKSRGEWTVTEEGRGPTLGTFLKKETALRRAKKEAKAKGLSQVKVKGEDGKIQTEYTYGDDPRDIRG